MIDTHAHLMFSQFEGDLDAVIARAKEAGVDSMVNIGCGIDSSRQAVEMLEEGDFLYATLGVHPYDASFVTEELIKGWEKLIDENERIVAVGECGLDYFKAKVSPSVQKDAFRMQLDLAMNTDLPVIVHNRDADVDCLEILDEYDGGLKVVFHCYGSDLKFAEEVWKRGYFTSFTGIITFPKAEELREVVKAVPMDKFMVETDCPYLAPQAHRGERNEPAYVVEVAKKIAEIKGISLEEVEKASTENALGFFSRM